MSKKVRLVQNVSGTGFNQVAPEHGLTKGRVLDVVRINKSGSPVVITDAGEEMWLRKREFEEVGE